MAIAGIGTDIVEIARIEKAVARQPRLVTRLLTEAEQQAYAVATHPVRYLAKRFAAKEAALKALGTGLQNGLSWQHIEISNTPLGQPRLTFSGVAEQRAKELQVHAIHLSLSDEANYAQAMVVLESA
ncbi:MAG: holo-ACP synthase [Idiomarina sp.]|nr:holo-ACP synthase [Idiomarina sp.]